MTIFEITTVILLLFALSIAYEELLEQEREEQKEYYQYVKENWMYLKGGDDE